MWLPNSLSISIKIELCDLLVIFEEHVFIFSVKDIKFNIEKDLEVAWSRWKKKAIDVSIKQILGAEKWILSNPNNIYLDPKCERILPVNLPKDSIKIHKIIVVHGAKDACKNQSPKNVAGSLAIAYTHKKDFRNFPFLVNLDREGLIHVLDSHNLEIILKELDTITDLSNYFSIKEEAVKSLDILIYCGEEDLLAHYLENIDEETNQHLIIPKEEFYTKIYIEEGMWVKFSKTQAYLNKKQADKISYFWDELLQRTSQNAIDGTLEGNADIFNGLSAIKEMAKEPRFMRRVLSEKMLKSVETFPETDAKYFRKVSAGFSNGLDKAYVLLQIKDSSGEDFENIIRPRRAKMLEIACGAFKNICPTAKKVIGVAINSPKYSNIASEDFLLMDCSEWSKKDREYYEEENRLLNFFGSKNLQMSEFNAREFPVLKGITKNKTGRNDPCPCGSGKKYKKCCLNNSL